MASSLCLLPVLWQPFQRGVRLLIPALKITNIVRLGLNDADTLNEAISDDFTFFC